MNAVLTTRRNCRCRGRFGSRMAALALAVAILAGGAGSALGQMTPLENFVPLADLEVRNDDLIRLSTAYTDATRELSNARLTLDTLTALRPNAVITNLEFQIAQVNLQSAQQKVCLLRAIAERLLAAAEARLDILRRLEKMGDGTSRPVADSQTRVRIAQAESAVKILKMLLQNQ